MHIKEMKSQHRRDFIAEFECEHCGFTKTRGGYDDANFHNKVIPQMKCDQCCRTASDAYAPRATKYAEHEIV